MARFEVGVCRNVTVTVEAASEPEARRVALETASALPVPEWDEYVLWSTPEPKAKA